LFSSFSHAQEISSHRSIEKKIRIEVLRESAIAPYGEQIFLICKQVYQEYPYLYLSREDDGYADYFKSLAEIQNSIVCLAFEEEKVVGIATGFRSRRHSLILLRHLMKKSRFGKHVLFGRTRSIARIS
jgi:dihydropteroate synthase